MRKGKRVLFWRDLNPHLLVKGPTLHWLRFSMGSGKNKSTEKAMRQCIRDQEKYWVCSTIYQVHSTTYDYNNFNKRSGDEVEGMSSGVSPRADFLGHLLSVILQLTTAVLGDRD